MIHILMAATARVPNSTTCAQLLPAIGQLSGSALLNTARCCCMTVVCAVRGALGLRQGSYGLKHIQLHLMLHPMPCGTGPMQD